MSMRVLFGNVLERATVTMYPGADPNYPEKYLSDGPGMLGARFIGAPDPYLVIDTNQVPYGGGEADGQLAGALPTLSSDWTASPETATLNSGGGNLDLSDLGNASAKIRLALGGTYRLSVKSNGINGTTARVRLFDPAAGRYLTPAGSWSAVVTDFSSILGEFPAIPDAVASATMQVAPPADIEVQLIAESASSSKGYFTVALVPQVDMLGVFNGHNVPGSIVATWYAGDLPDASDITAKAVLTVGPHQFWKRVEPFTARFHQLNFVGTTGDPVYLSDLVLGLTTLLPRSPSSPFTLDHVEKQTRLETPGGTRHISNRGPYAPRSLTFDFKMPDDATFTALRDQLFVASRGGAVPAVLFPSSEAEPDLAIYGDLSASMSFARSENAVPYRDCSIQIDEGAGFEIR